MNTSASTALASWLNQIPEPNAEKAQAAQARLNQLTKPIGSLGALEDLAIRLSAMTGQLCPTFGHLAVLIAAGDHGVVAERVSPYPQEVTAQMVLNFLRGGAAINALAAQAGARVIVADAGIASELPEHPRLRRVAVSRGTRNLIREPAMTREQAVAAILAGAQIVTNERETGLDLLALGEMGIGNTTIAACLTSAFTGAPADQTAGRGTGLDDAGLHHKRAVIAAALKRAQPQQSDPLGTLAELGGFEIALLVGAMIGAAVYRIPIVLDGYVVSSAALVAVAIAPTLRHYLIAGHRSAEPGHRLALAHLGLSPLLVLEMRLGEGSGAALALPLIQATARTMREMATFEEAGVREREEDTP